MTEPIKLLILGDVQYPFHDKATDEVVNKFMEDFKPDMLVFNGDILDAPGISAYLGDPNWRGNLLDELEGAKDYLSEKARIVGGQCSIHFNEGNHEDRLRKYLWKNAPELAAASGLSLPSLLGLDDLGASYTPYYNGVETAGSPGISIFGLLIVHGWIARKWSGASAKAAYEHFGGSGVVGHTHRLGAFYHTNYSGVRDGLRDRRTDVWYEGGTLASLDPFYMPVPDWQQGLIAGYIFPDESQAVSRFSLSQVPIVSHKLIWEGQLYQ